MVNLGWTATRDDLHRKASRVRFLKSTGTESNEICGAGTSVAGFGMILMTGGGTMVDGLSGGCSVDTDSTMGERLAKERGGESKRGLPG